MDKKNWILVAILFILYMVLVIAILNANSANMSEAFARAEYVVETCQAEGNSKMDCLDMCTRLGGKEKKYCIDILSET